MVVVVSARGNLSPKQFYLVKHDTGTYIMLSFGWAPTKSLCGPDGVVPLPYLDGP